MRVLVVLVVIAELAAAAPRGDAVIDHFSLQALRTLDLATLSLGDPLTAAQYVRIVELRRQHPELLRLGALEDADLSAVAAALCHADAGACVDATLHALRCLAERCTVAAPPAADLVDLPRACQPSNIRDYEPAYGVGFDWGMGWQRSKYPSDGGAWSFGIEGRTRFGRFLGAVARVDRVAGRDAAEDANGDGSDDIATGSIVRITALAGPSIVLDNTRYESTTRFLRLDLLGGYIATRSQPNENGAAAGVDLAYQVSIVRFGFRFVQGFGDARGATMLLAHLGLSDGSVPPLADVDCVTTVPARSSRLALGFDFPLGGYGFSSELGYMVPGIGIEAVWHLTRRIDAVTRADLLIFPGYNQDRVLHQALLGGLRLDSAQRDTGFYTTITGGYSQGIGVTPTSAGSGPIVDISIGWGGESSDAAGFLRLHGRFGVGSDNLDYRALFLSAGFELRVDPDRWRDRI